MPNWIDNTLTLRGDGWEEAASEIESAVEREGNFISSFIPQDPRCTKQHTFANENHASIGVFTTLEKDGFDGYRWCLDNWGVKWPDSDTAVTWGCENAQCTTVTFTTPWSSPVTALQTISRRWPAVTFQMAYLDEGDGYDELHEFAVQNGEVSGV